MSTGWWLGTQGFGWAELWALFAHFTVLSLLSIGGAITTASDMQRYLVGERGWMSDADFTTSVAIAQAAPGPNVLFVAVLGWQLAGLAGLLAAMLGIMLPSTVLALAASRFSERHRATRGVRAFNAGLAPLTVGLLLATGTVLLEPYLRQPAQRVAAIALAAFTVLAMLRTRIGPLWLIALGAAVGALGWV